MDHNNQSVAYDVVVIGGGVAGLSAAIHCNEKGLKTALIEAGTYPSHKICGEFFSPESLPILARWNIVPEITIDTITIVTAKQQHSLVINPLAGSMSRFKADHQLAKYAQAQGVGVITNTRAEQIEPPTLNNPGLIKLSTGSSITTKQMIIGTGRVAQQLQGNKSSPTTPLYVGIKAHFTGVSLDQPSSLIMHACKDAYIGASHVEPDVINVASLISKKLYDKFTTPESCIAYLAQQTNNQQLQTVITQGKLTAGWLSCSVPGFGVAKHKTFDGIYYLGDAAGTIPPASGDGLSLSITSGKLVADYVVNNDSKGFARAWHKTYAPVIRNGILLHHIMLHPMLTRIVITLCNIFPKLARAIFSYTRCSRYIQK